MEVKERGQFELRPADALDIVMAAIAIGSNGEWGVLDRPDGPAMI
jgi:hypothetical protein